MSKNKDLMIPGHSDLPSLGGIPAPLNKIIVPDIKQISPDAGFFTRKFHKGRVRDFVEIAEAEAAILESQKRSYDITMDVMHRHYTESARVGHELLAIEHSKIMMGMEQREKEALIAGLLLDNEMKRALIKKVESEQRKIDIEALLDELDFKYRAKQYEEMSR